ncbi:ribosomal lysine N-methyltransferase 2 [Trichomonascus vanleenenianus]|uniref:protein-lysine N-methyltransferase n=1 Tax=Trichomonascus vanleenenianus TaxID=2268995 RepID=UPI003EC99289
MEQFYAWLKEGGSFVSPKIAVQDLPGRGRGVVATEEIPKGTILANIKRKQLVNFETLKQRIAKEDAIGRKALGVLPGPLLLAWYVYRHMDDPNNYWAPFIRMLPTVEELKTVPLMWAAQERGQLPSGVLRQLLTQYTKFQSDVELVKNEVCDEKLRQEFDVVKFKHAWLCVNTRCIYMNVPGTVSRVDKLTLAPFADYLNHVCDESKSIKLNISTTGLEIISKVDYAIGEEIYLTYGPHDNSTLLTEYGFVVDSNPWDSVDISNQITPLLQPSHRDVLSQLGYYGDQYTLELTGPSFRTEMAVAALSEQSLGASVPDKLMKLADGMEEAIVLYGYQYKQMMLDVLAEVSRRIRLLRNKATNKSVQVLLERYDKTVDKIRQSYE